LQIDDEAITLLRQQIEASLALAAEEKRKNDLLEASLKQTQVDAQIRQVAERNRLRTALDTNEKVAGIAEALPGVFLAIYGMQEWQKEDSRWKDRVDDILLLLLTGRGNGNKARVTELKDELEREHYQRLLMQEDFNLQQLEQQAAAHGGLVNAPVKLHNDIRKTKQRIEELQEKLAD
jgi:hypothetical protein